ncbi:unnamed protein product, partial [Brenthis ino]
MPIAMTKDEWSRINKWKESREDPEVVRRREYVKFLNETSREMTKQWPNSLENVNKRNEELRRARIEAAERANTKFYKRYVKHKQEEQQRLMHTARDTMFKNKDAPKMLLSAVIETVVLKERQEQIKFKREIQQKEAEQKKKDDDDIIQKSKEWHELMALRRKRRFDANKQHQKEILDQAHEVSERKREEYEAELNMQKIDNIKADKQMAAIREFEEDFKASEKARIWADMERAREEAGARRRERAARAALDARLLLVLQRSQRRVDAKRRQTEKQIQDDRLQVLQRISEKLESGDAARDAREQSILLKAIEEKEAIAEASRQAQQRKQEKFRQERVETRRQFLRDEEKRLQDFNTMRQWEVMNRFKNAELFEAFQEKLREDKALKIQQYREDLLKLWREREEREARERAETRYFYGARAEAEQRAADAALLAHARALLREAARRGRPAAPLEKAVDRYCRMHRLQPAPAPPAARRHGDRPAPADIRDGLTHATVRCHLCYHLCLIIRRFQSTVGHR